jgi:23S rRNA pseudouridine2605 synthase
MLFLRAMDSTGLERLQKIISRAGLASRREAEQWIREGRVSVNGAVISRLGSQADPAKDSIKVDEAD